MIFISTHNMLDRLQEAIKKRIDEIRFSRQRYVFSHDSIDHLSIAYSTIRLPKECKEVTVWYSQDLINLYKEILALYGKCTQSRDKSTSSRYIMGELTTLVNGWNTQKEVDSESISHLSAAVERIYTRMQQFNATFDKKYKYFLRKNTDSENFMDHVSMKLYRYTTEFPYHRFQNYFFKKDGVDDKKIRDAINTDLEYLERILNLMQILYSGYDKVGKGEEYEMYRMRQRQLIYIIKDFVNALELEIQFYEKILQILGTVIVFKVYPKK